VRGIEFLGQAIWRYQPESKAFELFAEGGGNPWTLDLDSKGRIFVGTNNGATRGLHFVQGGYYVKNWPKHGSLTNPYAFGFFPHMAHSGYQPRFSQTLVIYEGGALPGYEGQMIAGMALTNRVQASRVLQDTSSFRTEDTEPVVLSNSRWFRPVDSHVGPDGAVYIADWCDIRLSHLSPHDNWDKSNGRIYRLKAKDAPPIKPFDLSKLNSRQLVETLSHQNEWFREQAKRLLADRRDPTVIPMLRELVQNNEGQLALEALWSVHLSGGWNDTFALKQLGHPDEYVRYWTVRLLGDSKKVGPAIQGRLKELARTETSVGVRSQLASSCKRLPARDALSVVRELLLRREDVDDLHIPLLLWWALESKVAEDLPLVLQLLKDPTLWEAPLFKKHIAARLGQRFTTERGDRLFYTLQEAEYSSWLTNYVPSRCRTSLKISSQLLDLAPTMEARDLLMRGMEVGLRGDSVELDPSPLQQKISQLALAQPTNAVRMSLALRLKINNAAPTALRMLGDATLPVADRTTLAAALADLKVKAAVPVFLDLLDKDSPEVLRAEVLRGLQHSSAPEIATRIIASLKSMPRQSQQTALGVLAGRNDWASVLLAAVDRGQIDPSQISEATLAVMRRHGNPEQTALIAKHWHITEQKNAALGGELQTIVQLGEQSYRSRCSYCHLASGEGMKKALVNSKWVQGTDRGLICILLQGKQGESEVMPGFGAEMDDTQIASLLTYIRRQWGNQPQPIEPHAVRDVRSVTADRKKPWTEAELLDFVK
jgi:mono/diheme cytochrome c family protein/predicted small integral membrane protein